MSSPDGPQRGRGEGPKGPDTSPRRREAARSAAAKKGIALQTPKVASLFSFFFNENPVENCSDAMASSADLYKKFFWGCLDRGVYFAPSAYEICFMSAAHTDDDLSRAAEAISESIAAL